jgi:hypothetical protein
MATYLTLANAVLNRMNEVELTASNFASARGFQIQCKNAVNDAIDYVNQREFGWPFNHSGHSQTLVAGTTRYTIPTDAKHIDYQTFRISKDSSLASPGNSLDVLEYKEYVDKFIDQEDDATVIGGLPEFVFRTPDNNFGLYPYPNKAYQLKFDYHTIPTALSAATDTPTIPDQFSHVIVDGATAYAYQYRGESQQYQLNFARFDSGIKHMQSILLNRFDYMRSTFIERPKMYGSGLL